MTAFLWESVRDEVTDGYPRTGVGRELSYIDACFIVENNTVPARNYTFDSVGDSCSWR